MTAVRDLVAGTADSLARQQARVDVRTARALAGDGWDARLAPADRAALALLGHFPAYAAELDWTPREVAGHLRDSALVFTERIYRMRTQDDPRLPDFLPTDPARVAGYRAVAPVQLVEQLRAAQAALFRSVAGLRTDELDRTGVHETNGRLRLADVLTFLPGHQHDHAEQLAALLGG
jgi:hypothetical protein